MNQSTKTLKGKLELKTQMQNQKEKQKGSVPKVIPRQILNISSKIALFIVNSDLPIYTTDTKKKGCSSPSECNTCHQEH